MCVVGTKIECCTNMEFMIGGKDRLSVNCQGVSYAGIFSDHNCIAHVNPTVLAVCVYFLWHKHANVDGQSPHFAHSFITYA